MDFGALMAKVNAELDQKFEDSITAAKANSGGKISIREYKCLFLGSFLPGGDSPQHWHAAIDGTSLCQPEVDFFHKFADLPDNEDGTTTTTDPISFMNAAMKAYEQTEDLEGCQLGGCIKNRLGLKFL